MIPKPLLLLAVGNESRGDDALGPLLARRVQAWLASTGMDSQVEVIEEFQLQIEHTLDIKDRQLLLFVDAGQGHRAAICFLCSPSQAARWTQLAHPCTGSPARSLCPGAPGFAAARVHPLSGR